MFVEVDQVRERLKVTDARSCDSDWTQKIIWFRFSEEVILDENQSQLYTRYGLDRSIHPGYKHIQHTPLLRTKPIGVNGRDKKKLFGASSKKNLMRGTEIKN
jgi:hypothetical protein